MSESEFDFHHLIFQRVLEAEAQLLTNFDHSLVFDKRVTGETLEVFVAPKLNQLAQQFGP
jgi:hypothetical protein